MYLSPGSRAARGRTGALAENDLVVLPSAALVDLGAVAAQSITISGTVTITSFGARRLRRGSVRFVRFSGALTLTHNATSLILPGALNITTASGDTLTARYEGSGNWRVLDYARGTGSPLAATVGAVQLATSIPASGFDAPINIGITASVGSSALTIAVKGADGNDASALNPVLIPFRSPTAATGTPVWRTLSAASSLVVTSGSTLGAISGASFALKVVLFDDGGTLRLGVINAIGTPVDDTYVASSTAEGGAGAADSADTYYTGTAVSSKAFRVLGTLYFPDGLATAGTWSASATTIQLEGGAPSRPKIGTAPFDAMAYMGLEINGGMEVSQEVGTTSTAVVSATDKYIVDQWLLGFTSAIPAVVVGQQISATPTPPAGFSAALQMKATTADASLAAGEYFCMRQPIEGLRTARLGFGAAGAQAVTIGFWVYTTIAGTMTASIRNSATNRSYVTDVTINNAATWEYKTVTIPGDTSGTWLTTTGVGLHLTFCFGSGSTYQGTNNTWNAANNFATASTTNFFASNNNVAVLTGVTVLPGTEMPISARSQNRRHFADEHRACQRYWQKSYGYGTAPAANDQLGAVIVTTTVTASYTPLGSVRFPVVMRAAPTITLYSPLTGSTGSPIRFLIGASDNAGATYGIGDTGFLINVNGVSVGANEYIMTHYVANARL